MSEGLLNTNAWLVSYQQTYWGVLIIENAQVAQQRFDVIKQVFSFTTTTAFLEYCCYVTVTINFYFLILQRLDCSIYGTS